MKLKSSFRDWLLLVLLFCWFFVTAAAETKPPAGVFDAYDANKDGRVVKEEYLNGVKITTFEKVDRDNNKVISWEEWEHLDQTPGSKENFSKMDTDNNKTVSFLEYSAAVDKYSNADEAFSLYDINADGQLTDPELPDEPLVKIFSVKF